MIDETELRAESAQMEYLLDELRDLVPMPAWQRIERVLRVTIALHAAGLAHALDFARRAGASTDFDELIAGDELLGSLLSLHGLHPLPTEERVRRTIEAVRRDLAIGDDALAFVDCDDGAVKLVANAGLGGGAMSPHLAEGVIRRAIEAAAPEVTSIEIAGLAPPRDPKLVQIRRREAP